MMQNINFSEIQTPFYLYDLDLLERTAAIAAREAGKQGYFVHYAIKANHQPEILELMKKAGFGIDCVSGNEVRAALQHGFPAEKIAFAGVGKTDAEILLAFENGIFSLNCESVEELEVIGMLAKNAAKLARVALRVNPGIDAKTHQNITTGLAENKFGIPLSQLKQALDFCAEHPYIHFIGLHFHIGSQITSPDPFIKLCQRAGEIWEAFDIAAYGGTVLNLGGGLGIHYENPTANPVPDFAAFFKLVAENLNVSKEVKIHFELGRSMVGQCGSLVTRVLYVKKGQEKQFVIVDAGMTELMRPALYQAVHRIENLNSDQPERKYDIVGPICESSDVFAKDYTLPETSRGDILFIRSCGAYAQSMSLRYNLRSLAPAYFIRQNEFFTNLSGQPELSLPVFV
jgi:diaminopimelate decarboxylase